MHRYTIPIHQLASQQQTSEHKTVTVTLPQLHLTTYSFIVHGRDSLEHYFVSHARGDDYSSRSVPLVSKKHKEEVPSSIEGKRELCTKLDCKTGTWWPGATHVPRSQLLNSDRSKTTHTLYFFFITNVTVQIRKSAKRFRSLRWLFHRYYTLRRLRRVWSGVGNFTKCGGRLYSIFFRHAIRSKRFMVN